MFIEFSLYRDWYLDGIPELLTSIGTWSNRHNARYQTKIVKNCLRVTFDDDRNYVWFMATWQDENWRTKLRLITQRNL